MGPVQYVQYAIYCCVGTASYVFSVCWLVVVVKVLSFSLRQIYHKGTIMYIVSYRIDWYCVVLYCIASHNTVSSRIVSHRIKLYCIILNCIVSYPIVSICIRSFQIVSYRIKLNCIA